MHTAESGVQKSTSGFVRRGIARACEPGRGPAHDPSHSMSASLHYSQGADRKGRATAAVHLLETRRKGGGDGQRY